SIPMHYYPPVSNSNDMRLACTNLMKFLFLIAYIEVLPVRFVACEVRHFVQLSLFVVQRFGTFVLLVCFLFAAQIVQNLPLHSLTPQSFVYPVFQLSYESSFFISFTI